MSRKGTGKLEYWDTEVSESGNGAHAFVPKQWLGKKVRITLVDEEK